VRYIDVGRYGLACPCHRPNALEFVMVWDYQSRTNFYLNSIGARWHFE